MKSLDTGKEKIQKICDAIRKETLDPAKQEAREIIENAHLQAGEIVREAREKAEKVKRDMQSQIEEKKRIFQSSLQLSCRQGIEMLKQKIEQELFHRELVSLVHEEMIKPEVIKDFIQSFVHSLEKQGIEEDFQILIPKEISPREINALLTQRILQRLREEPIQVSDFHAGLQIRMKEKRVTIDISDQVIKELIANYIRRDFRDLVFQG